MAKDTRLDPVEYLDRFFDVIRDEVRENPKFADRLVKALGAEVVFEEEAKAETANPYTLAASSTKSQFYSVFSTLKQAQLKRVLRDNNLASPLDIRGKTPGQLIDMLYERAVMKVAERRSSFF